MHTKLSAETWLHLEIAACGALLVVWTLLPHGLWHHAGFLLLLWPIAGYARRVRHDASARAAAPMRSRA